jgi:formylglycine-generating enzyme required for sulfatase activity
MHGNVYEWCLDSYAGYITGPVTDPFVTGGFGRVVRGGSWSDNSNVCRSAYRSNGNPGDASDNAGFRVVLAPVLVP